MIETLPPQLRANIIVDDCWLWTGSVMRQGYGRLNMSRGSTSLVHRLVWSFLIGVIPAGKELHHKCSNKRCCNPEHMKLVTRQEHCAIEPHNHRVFSAQCIRGHTLDGYSKRGRRYCKTCNRNRMRESRTKALV